MLTAAGPAAQQNVKQRWPWQWNEDKQHSSIMLALRSIYHAAQLVALTKTSSAAAIMLACSSSYHAAQLAAMMESCASAATGDTGQDAACMLQQLLGEHCQHVKKLAWHRYMMQEVLPSWLSEW